MKPNSDHVTTWHDHGYVWNPDPCDADPTQERWAGVALVLDTQKECITPLAYRLGGLVKDIPC